MRPAASSQLETKVDAALDAINSAYKAQAAQVSWFRSPDYSTLFSDIENTADEFLTWVTSETDKPSDITERLRKRRANLPLSSDINTEVVGVCKQILAFGSAGLGLSLGFIDKIFVLNPALQKFIAITGIVYLELTLVSLCVLFLYLLQDRFRYPFLSFKNIGNEWPYFYYGIISDDVSRKAIQFAPDRLHAAWRYADNLVRFSKQVVTETAAAELRVELQQHFLLLAYQGYVHQFSLRLTNWFFYGLSGALITGVALVICALLT